MGIPTTPPPVDKNSTLEVNLNLTISLDEKEIDTLTRYLQRTPTEEDLLDLVKVTFLRGGSHSKLTDPTTGHEECERRMGLDIAEVLALSVSEHSIFEQ